MHCGNLNGKELQKGEEIYIYIGAAKDIIYIYIYIYMIHFAVW